MLQVYLGQFDISGRFIAIDFLDFFPYNCCYSVSLSLSFIITVIVTVIFIVIVIVIFIVIVTIKVNLYIDIYWLFITYHILSLASYY